MVMQKRAEAFNVSIKGGNPRNVVTSVDLAINEFIVGEIRKAFPGHGIYSEEGGGVESSSEQMWVIDPIDGTANFSRAIPHFAVCIGLLEKGVPVVGAVYNPVTQELFSFKKGEGAFLNSESIHVSSITELAQSHVFLRAGRNPDNWEWGGEAYKKLLSHANKTGSFAGSALDLCFIAAGRIEAVIYGNLNTMDVASAFGILKEAGGVASGGDGSDIAFSAKPYKWFAANNKKILEEVRTLLG